MQHPEERLCGEPRTAVRLFRAVAAMKMRILLSTCAVTVAVLVVADIRSPVRAVLTFVFLMIVPGRALLDCWHLSNGWLGTALVISTSASLATVLATVQLYAGVWSPPTTVVVLALVTVVAQSVIVSRTYRCRPVDTSPPFGRIRSAS
jgi:uncharacterized membrane protein